MAVKIVLLLLFIAIFTALGSGLVHLLRGTGDSRRLAKSLTWRIGISLAVFILLILAMLSGLIKPHGI